MTPPAAPGAPPAEGTPPPVSSRFIDTYDANQDGKVTKDEFTGDVEVFGLLDKDGDGAVTNVALGLHADYRPRPLPPPPRDDGPGAKGGNLQKRLEEFKVKLAEMDANKDGKVSQAEWNDVHAKHFAKMDKNGDGFLTRDEMGKGPGCDMRMKGAKHHGGGKCPRGQAPAGK